LRYNVGKNSRGPVPHDLLHDGLDVVDQRIGAEHRLTCVSSRHLSLFGAGRFRGYGNSGFGGGRQGAVSRGSG
jgi:hypothetical protein